MKTLISKLVLYRFILSVIFMTIGGNLFGQLADLVLTGIAVSSFSPTKGSDYEISLEIKNIGNARAGQSYLYYYLSRDLDFTIEKVIGRVSVKSLGVNESTIINIETIIPFNTPSASHYIGVGLDVSNQVQESNESNLYYLSQRVNIGSSTTPRIKIPYPIVFIHGLVGTSDTWDELTFELSYVQRLSFGGRLDFCLNYDNNHSTSNLSTDYKDFTDPSKLKPADYYTLNFAVSPNGVKYSNARDPNKSNQAAIVKQGKAVGDAIKHILKVTGRNKVILVGHSMGGLAAREYIQNPIHHQSDREHHVAKLLTIGTPHGGSNLSAGGLGFIFKYDELSEAVRDLRTNYHSGYSGAFLFGGLESNTRISGAFENFHNVDVNCNGRIGDNIVGLNQKALPESITYACIIGTGYILEGDGVVSRHSANLQNFTHLKVDTFIIKQSLLDPDPHHMYVHKKSPVFMKGVDEADDPEHAYKVEFGNLYQGFVTPQSTVGGYQSDFDMFYFNVVSDGNAQLRISNIPVAIFSATIYDSSGNIISTGKSQGNGNIILNAELKIGTYYVEFESSWTGLSYRFPYSFRLGFESSVSTIQYLTHDLKVYISPNPARELVNIQLKNAQLEDLEITLTDMNGKVLHYQSGKYPVGLNHTSIDITSYPPGMYLVNFKGDKIFKSEKLVIVE